MPDTASPSPLPPMPQSFDEPLGRKIIEMHVWAVGEGLRGTEAAPLFEGFCRRLAGPEAQLDFPDLDQLAAAGGTDYFAEIVRFGETDDPSRGTGIGYSFATDRPEGFSDDDLVLLKAVLPVVSLAMMAHAGHTI